VSLKVFHQLKKEFKLDNTEVIAYDYARSFFQNSSLPQELVEQITEMKQSIKNETGVKIDAYRVGRNDSIVMIVGMGSLLERSPEAFETIRGIIRRYVSSEILEGSAKTILRTKQKSSAPTKEKSSVVVKRRETPKPKTKEKKSLGDKGDMEGIVFEGEIEMSFTKFIVEEDTEVCPTMIEHAVENFSISEEEAKEKLIAWAQKNVDIGSLEYDADYMDGEGIINRTD